MAQILVYVDQGVDGAALKQLIRSLKQEIDSSIHTISRIDAKDLAQKTWEKEARLLIVPGGRDVFYHGALHPAGTERIRIFVERGGGYLGICAGAYFGCDRIEFEKGGPLEVCGERSLKFFPGVAKGPVYGNNKYSYESPKGAEAARISWQEEHCHVYFNGGCTFETARELPHVITLSRYLDVEHSPPAIISVPLGKGMATLSGVHIEYNATLFPGEDPHLGKIAPLLKEAEEGRRKIFREILRQHHICTI